MKIRCNKSSLANGISIVSKAVPVHTTMPILECVLIDASAAGISLIANDMELGIQTGVEGEILEKGIIAVDAGIFSGIVRKLPEEEVEIETNIEEITIRCGKAKFSILGKEGRDFAYLPDIEKNEGIFLSQFTLREMITRTIFSISDNESNRMMTGELLEVKNGVLTFVTLDGHRISIRRSELSGEPKDRRVVIPGKTLSEVSKILGGDTEKQCGIYFTDRHVLFEFDSTVVVSRLIDGEYFRIEQMLSGDYETRMTVNRKVLVDCLDRATLLVKEGDKKPIILTIGDDNMALKIHSAIGSMDESVEVDKTGRDLVIGFNPRFLLDALRAISDEQVDIYFVNPKAPCFIRDTAETYNYVVLPVNFTSVG